MSTCDRPYLPDGAEYLIHVGNSIHLGEMLLHNHRHCPQLEGHNGLGGTPCGPAEAASAAPGVTGGGEPGSAACDCGSAWSRHRGGHCPGTVAFAAWVAAGPAAAPPPVPAVPPPTNQAAHHMNCVPGGPCVYGCTVHAFGMAAPVPAAPPDAAMCLHVSCPRKTPAPVPPMVGTARERARRWLEEPINTDVGNTWRDGLLNRLTKLFVAFDEKCDRANVLKAELERHDAALARETAKATQMAELANFNHRGCLKAEAERDEAHAALTRETERADKAEAGWHAALDARKDEQIRAETASAERDAALRERDDATITLERQDTDLAAETQRREEAEGLLLRALGLSRSHPRTPSPSDTKELVDWFAERDVIEAAWKKLRT